MPRKIFLVPPEQWRHLLRALLRECTYLPDPIARGYMHDHVLSRYREVSQKFKQENLCFSHLQIRQQSRFPDIIRQVHLRRSAKHTLSLLARANEGYIGPLQRILLSSYGRIGRKRHQLLQALLDSEPLPQDTQSLKELVNQPGKFQDGWEPPKILMDLLKAQKQNSTVSQSRVRKQVKALAPTIPKENSWGRPMPLVRRRTFRSRWYTAALDSALPPIPESERNVLRGLLLGTQPWAPVPRRKAPAPPAQRPSKTPLLDAGFLALGPKKGATFSEFTRGRPHKITRRFMRSLWGQIYGLIPESEENAVTRQRLFRFSWRRRGPEFAVSIKKHEVEDLLGFGGLDERGRKLTDKPKLENSQ